MRIINRHFARKENKYYDVRVGVILPDGKKNSKETSDDDDVWPINAHLHTTHVVTHTYNIWPCLRLV